MKSSTNKRRRVARFAVKVCGKYAVKRDDYVSEAPHGRLSVRRSSDLNGDFLDQPMGRCMFTSHEYADAAAVRAGYKADEYTIEKILI